MPRTRRLIAASLLAVASALPAAARQDAAPGTPPVPAPAEPPAASAPADLPSVDSVLAKAAEAVGGREAWSKVRSMRTKGSFGVPAAGISGPMVTEMAQPNRIHTRMDLAGIGEVRTGFDGTTGWATDKIQGPRLMTGDEVETLRREAEMMKDFDVRGRYDSLEVVKDATHGGFACWELVGKKGDETTTLWFEKETGLARGSRMKVKSPLGEIPVESTVSEYRAFEGDFGRILLPVAVEVVQMGQKLSTTVESAEFNCVDDAAFALPVAIRALLEPEPEDDADDMDADDMDDDDMDDDDMDDDDMDDAAKPASAPAAPAAPKTPAAPAPKR